SFMTLVAVLSDGGEDGGGGGGGGDIVRAIRRSGGSNKAATSPILEQAKSFHGWESQYTEAKWVKRESGGWVGKERERREKEG
ncbi:hypothetical protein PSY81_23585, partial [Shigella flexneri]|nr:hypothetical protein [Shigella flexneri]